MTPAEPVSFVHGSFALTLPGGWRSGSEALTFEATAPEGPYEGDSEIDLAAKQPLLEASDGSSSATVTVSRLLHPLRTLPPAVAATGVVEMLAADGVADTASAPIDLGSHEAIRITGRRGPEPMSLMLVEVASEYFVIETAASDDRAFEIAETVATSIEFDPTAFDRLTDRTHCHSFIEPDGRQIDYWVAAPSDWAAPSTSFDGYMCLSPSGDEHVFLQLEPTDSTPLETHLRAELNLMNHPGDTIELERRSVVLGRSDDVAIEILEGIVPDDMVAVSGALALQTGYAALR